MKTLDYKIEYRGKKLYYLYGWNGWRFLGYWHLVAENVLPEKPLNSFTEAFNYFRIIEIQEKQLRLRWAGCQTLEPELPIINVRFETK